MCIPHETPLFRKKDSLSVCPSSLANQEPSATHSIPPAIIHVPLNNFFPFENCSTLQEQNKTILQMLTKSSHYLFHGIAEIRDVKISKPWRTQRMPMQGTHCGKAGAQAPSFLCIMNLETTTADESLYFTLQQKFSRLQNLKTGN